MKFVKSKSGRILDKADILIRAYESQDPNAPEAEMFAGDILFRPHVGIKNVFFTAAFPRGLVEAIKDALPKIKGDWTVQIANELPPTVGHLNYCNEHFDIRFKNEIGLIRVLP